MNAKDVNDAFEQAWDKYKMLKDEVDTFCDENNLTTGILKVEMAGPHVKIKHGLTPTIWSNDLHDKLCERFGVHLDFFARERLKTKLGKPPLSVYRWTYSHEVFDEKFILDYDEVLSI